MIDCVIKGLTADSRQVQPGDLFVALVGETVDGRAYIPEAVQRGAVAVLSEAGSHSDLDVPIIEYAQLSKTLGFMASRFFSEPSKSLRVIGITGTNGKTSCSYYIAYLLSAWRKQCGIMGTLGVGLLDALQPMACTTPDVIFVHKALAKFREEGAFAVAMEVSSHALTQERVQGVEFDTAIFTNLTQDHLDYHGDMAHYWQAKKQLFIAHDIKQAVINLEDPKAQDLITALLQTKRISKNNIIGYTTSDISFISREALGGITIVKTLALYLDNAGISATIQTPWGKGQLECALLGRFNLSNILAALSAVCIQGMPFDLALQVIRNLPIVPGRMMCLGGKQQPLVVVDYAHTPDALKQVLMALRPHCRAKLWCVFGCGGERDRSKRPLMASIAETLSDKVIMTLDNPRREDPAQIFVDMMQGLKKPDVVMIEPDRVAAITHAIMQASPLDVILIAGKGHETVQIMGTESLSLNDYDEATAVLKRRIS
jgi:UDP-N-acetylmuramoyl-L-alanyl-D-glutamate--2,6-diaminopimelate ligase